MYATTLPIGDLATKVAAAVTARTTATTGLEAKFETWKTLASTAMTAYKLMIDTDTGVTTVHATQGCKVTGTPGSSNVVALTVYTSAMSAIVAAASDEATGARPNNLVTAIANDTAGSGTDANARTSCLARCNLMPSWGLKISGTGTAAFPTVATEVCQGIQTTTAATADTGSNNTARANLCKFISSGKRATTPTDYIDIADTGSAGTSKCEKRANQKGILWRAAVVLAQAVSQGTDYPTAVAGYTGFTGAVDTWITSRGGVILSYKAYLQFKNTCQKVGKSFLDQIVAVDMATKRVTGVRGTDITNDNLTEMYEDQWTAIFGEVPAVPTTINTTTPYLSLVPANASVTGTGKYPLYMQAKAATKVAADAHAAAKLEW